MSIDEAVHRLEAEDEDLARLAKCASLAVRVDAALIREIRLALDPRLDPGLEADLWFSPLVASKSIDGFLFEPEARSALQRRLHGPENRELRETAWRLTRARHPWLSPVIALEEEIAYLAAGGPADDADQNLTDARHLIRRAVVTLKATEGRVRAEGVAGVRADTHLGLAQWALGATERLPAELQASDEAKMLGVAGAARVGTRSLSDYHDEGAVPEWMSWVLPRDHDRVEVGVRLFGDVLELGAETAAETIPVPMEAAIELRVVIDQEPILEPAQWKQIDPAGQPLYESPDTAAPRRSIGVRDPVKVTARQGAWSLVEAGEAAGWTPLPPAGWAQSVTLQPGSPRRIAIPGSPVWLQASDGKVYLVETEYDTVFRIEIMGDSFWIEYGKAERPNRILVYGQGREPVMERLAVLPADERHFELVVASTDPDPLGVTFDGLWTNVSQPEVWLLNKAFSGKLVQVPAGEDPPAIQLPGGLTATVLAPEERLDVARKRSRARARLAPHMHAIGVLLEYKGSRVLLGGYASPRTLAGSVRKLLAATGADRLPLDAFQVLNELDGIEELLDILDVLRYLVPEKVDPVSIDDIVEREAGVTPEFVSSGPSEWEDEESLDEGAYKVTHLRGGALDIARPDKPVRVSGFLLALENEARTARPSDVRKAAFEESHLEVRMFNVGGGEAILLIFPTSRTWLIDGGSSNGRGANEHLAQLLVRYLEEKDLTLETCVASNPHVDHAGALATLLTSDSKALAPIITVYRGADGWNLDRRWLERYHGAISDVGQAVEEVILRNSFREVPIAKGVEARLFTGSGHGPYTSLFMQLRFGSARLLFTGEARCEYEMDLLNAFGAANFRADVLKVTHHGSSDGTAQQVLNSVAPAFAIASTGDDGLYRLKQDTLERLLGPNNGRRVFETLVDGDIIVRTDGEPYQGGILYRVYFDRPGEFAGAMHADIIPADQIERSRTDDPDC